MERKTGKTTKLVQWLKKGNDRALIVGSYDEKFRLIKVFDLNRDQAKRVFSVTDPLYGAEYNIIKGQNYIVQLDTMC